MQAHRISTNRGKIKVDDFKFALRKDPKKLARVDELLFMTEVISRARGKEDLTTYADPEDLKKGGAADDVVPPVGGGTATAVVPREVVVQVPVMASSPPAPKKKSKGKGKAKAV